MSSLIVVHPDFEAAWPFVADHFCSLWQAQGEAALLRLQHDDGRTLGQVVEQPETVQRLVCLGVPSSMDCLRRFTALIEATFQGSYNSRLDDDSRAEL